MKIDGLCKRTRRLIPEREADFYYLAIWRVNKRKHKIESQLQKWEDFVGAIVCKFLYPRNVLARTILYRMRIKQLNAKINMLADREDHYWDNYRRLMGR